jgi:hypothetical protein
MIGRISVPLSLSGTDLYKSFMISAMHGEGIEPELQRSMIASEPAASVIGARVLNRAGKECRPGIHS